MSKRKRKVVAVCGSSSFPLTVPVGAAILDLLLAYPQGTLFLTRGSPGFDTFLLDACPRLGLPIEMRPSGGGSRNWDRDVALVKESDEVVVFLDPATLTDEDTGTSHVLAKALDQRKRTQAYSAHGDTLVYVGSSGE
jgi:hypothetical protein